MQRFATPLRPAVLRDEKIDLRSPPALGGKGFVANPQRPNA
jgi:hypothetical protein